MYYNLCTQIFIQFFLYILTFIFWWLRFVIIPNIMGLKLRPFYYKIES